MLSFLLICFICGAFGAILQGIIGIGTGIIIVPLLTLMLPHYGYAPTAAMHIALATSMAAIAINSLSALYSHQRRGNIQWDLFNKVILFCIVGAGIGAMLASNINAYYLEAFYGLFLLWVSWVMMKGASNEQSVDTIPQLSRRKLATGGFGIGLFASLSGSGGGILMVPFLNKLNVNIRYAVGTSTLIGMPISLIGASTYTTLGASKVDMPYIVGYLHWPALLTFSIAGLLFAPIGVRLATHLPTHIVRRLFAACIILVALKMLWHLLSTQTLT